MVQVRLDPARIGRLGSGGVVSDGSVRIRLHHLSRACDGCSRTDLRRSDLLIRTDNGRVASGEGTAALSCLRLGNFRLSHQRKHHRVMSDAATAYAVLAPTEER